MTKNAMLGRVVAGAGIIVLVAVGTLVVASILDIPTVHFSVETETCVRVIPDTAGTCDSMPTKYHHVWVQ